MVFKREFNQHYLLWDSAPFLSAGRGHSLQGLPPGRTFAMDACFSTNNITCDSVGKGTLQDAGRTLHYNSGGVRRLVDL